MGLYNFKAQFVPFILKKLKKHTIRAERKYPAKVGETLYLYTGLRTKKAKKIAEVVCTRVERIVITNTPLKRIVVGDHMLDSDEEEALARRDGFKDFADMMKFWTGRLPFRGHIIHWKEKPCPVSTKKASSSAPGGRASRSVKTADVRAKNSVTSR